MTSMIISDPTLEAFTPKNEGVLLKGILYFKKN